MAYSWCARLTAQGRNPIEPRTTSVCRTVWCSSDRLRMTVICVYIYALPYAIVVVFRTSYYAHLSICGDNSRSVEIPGRPAASKLLSIRRLGRGPRDTLSRENCLFYYPHCRCAVSTQVDKIHAAETGERLAARHGAFNWSRRTSSLNSMTCWPAVTHVMHSQRNVAYPASCVLAGYMVSSYRPTTTSQRCGRFKVVVV